MSNRVRLTRIWFLLLSPYIIYLDTCIVSLVLLFIFIYLMLHIYVYHGICKEVKRQLVGVSSLLPPYGFQGLNLGCLAQAAGTSTHWSFLSSSCAPWWHQVQSEQHVHEVHPGWLRKRLGLFKPHSCLCELRLLLAYPKHQPGLLTLAVSCT